MFVIYVKATGRIRWTARTEPDLSFDDTLARLSVEDSALVREAGTYVVQDGVLADRVATLDENRQARTLLATTQMDARIAAGLIWSGTLFQIDPDSQTRIAAMGALALGSITDPAGSPWIDGFYWVAADNGHVPMDAATTYAFARAVALHVSGCILRLRAIKDAIAGATDQAALDAIDVTAGYPTGGV
jgi:hypothetical protein